LLFIAVGNPANISGLRGCEIFAALMRVRTASKRAAP
jgi:hypothetical protein